MTSESEHHQTTPPPTIIPLDSDRELQVALKHLEMIQDVKKEAGRKSLVLRSSSILITSTIYVLAPEDVIALYFLVPLLPIFCFWALDVYNVKQIHFLGDKYEEVRERYFSEDVLSMKLKRKSDETGKTWVDLLDKFADEDTINREPTLVLFYLPIATFILLYFLYQMI